MQVPEWIGWLFIVGSFLAGLIVQTIVRVRSARRGDGLLHEWALGIASFSLTVIAVWAIYFGIGGMVQFFG